MSEAAAAEVEGGLLDILVILDEDAVPSVNTINKGMMMFLPQV